MILRKVAVLLIAVTLGHSVPLQSTLLAGLMVLSIFAQHRYAPFEDQHLNDMEMGALVVVALLFLGGQLLYLDDVVSGIRVFVSVLIIAGVSSFFLYFLVDIARRYLAHRRLQRLSSAGGGPVEKQHSAADSAAPGMEMVELQSI